MTPKDGNFSSIEWCEYGIESRLDDILGHFDHLPMHLLGRDGGVRVVQYKDVVNQSLAKS